MEAPGESPVAGTNVGGIEIRELPSYPRFGRTWRAVVIPQNLNRDELIALARQLHKRDPVSLFHFFDDDSQYDQFRLWDQNYPDPAYPSPETWARRHYIAAMLDPPLPNGRRRWQLEARDSGMHLLLPDGSGTLAIIE